MGRGQTHLPVSQPKKSLRSVRLHMQAFILRPEEKQTLNTQKHTHIRRGLGVNQKQCYMQTDQGKSEALRIGREIVREFLTRERGILIICVYSKSEFVIAPVRNFHPHL